MKSQKALMQRIESLQRSTKRAREKAGEIVQDTVRAAEVSVTALGIGFIEGKRAAGGQGAMNVFGVPLSLAIGVAAHGAGIMGVGGAESHFKAIGDGALATYFSTLGFQAGKTGKISLRGDGMSSLPGRMEGQALSVEDLANLAAQ